MMGAFDLNANLDIGAGVDVAADINVGASFSLGTGVSVSALGVGGRQDPYLNYNFAVEIEGLMAGGFSEVAGLQTEIEVQEYREGGVNGYIHKRAGPAKYPSNLILKKGVTDVRALWDWYWDVSQGTIQRKNVSVLLLDSSGEEKLRWNFEQAYPVRWVGPNLKGNTSEVAVESVELAHSGLATASVSGGASFGISAGISIGVGF
jgi:phage tail-like protein